MNTNNENNTMNMTKKTFKPIRIRMLSNDFAFDNCFYIDFEVGYRSAVREVVKYLMGLGYVWMEYNKYWDCVWVGKNANLMTYGRVPLTSVGLERMMGYAA